MQTQSFRRLAIVNRGEPAMRVIHAVREFNREQDANITTIALFTSSDARAMFVREADEAVDIGSATFVDPRDGRRKNRYLDYAALESALDASRADAVWVGWGFVAEHADFAEMCERKGIVFVGPTSAVMRELGDKIRSKQLAERTEVPIAPWSGDAVEDVAAAQEHAKRLGYPLMVKASAGGGGRGIRSVRIESELKDAFESAQAEAASAFGDPRVFLERRVGGARHIEVQVIGDVAGTVWAVGVRDCTIQRRHQKVLEEAPSPALDAEQDASIREAARRLAAAAGYRNAGTVEFLYESETRTFSFLEVNARLQVEHPVTEMTTGLDLVKLQLHVARGGLLEGGPPASSGHAIEVRLNAEDPDNGFAPAPGVIELFRLPTGPGLRVDTGVAQGDSVAPEFDSMIAKLIAYGRTRDEALARLHRALGETTIVIGGGNSNKAFLMDLVARREVRESSVDNAWLDGVTASGEKPPVRHADVALLQAAVEAYWQDFALHTTRFFTSAARGRPKLGTEQGFSVDLSYRGANHPLRVLQVGPGEFRIEVDSKCIPVTVERLGKFERRIVVGKQSYRTLAVPQGTDTLVEIDGAPHRVSHDSGGVVRAPAPAVVLRIPVAVGDEVAAGDRVAVLEAMKMELSVSAPSAGRVKEITVTPNVQVDAGAPLLTLEPCATGPAITHAPRVQFESYTEAEADFRQTFERLRALVLGFDIDAGAARQIAAEWRALPADLPGLDAAELAILEAFVDVHSLFRRQPVLDDPDGADRGSTNEYLITWLTTMDPDGAGLPVSFVGKLSRAVGHYGLSSLERTSKLESALVRIYRSHESVSHQAQVLNAILSRRLEQQRTLESVAGDRLHRVLDRLVAASHGALPIVNDLARELRHACFDEKIFEASRRGMYAKVARLIDGIDAPGADPDALMRALVECPQPLSHRLISRCQESTPSARLLMLEALTRRLYRIRSFNQLWSKESDGRPYVGAQYVHDGSAVALLATVATTGEFAEAAAHLASIVPEVPAGSRCVADIHLWCPAEDEEPSNGDLLPVLNRVFGSTPLDRVAVTIAGPADNFHTEKCRHLTFRKRGSEFHEDLTWPGLHSLMAKRMHLWHLRHFQLQRLPSPEDVNVFHAVAIDNPKDERLFAVAEIRDLTAVRDEDGRILALPHLEGMLLETLAAIRAYQAKRDVRSRLQWNRVLLYIWPSLTLELEELHAMVRKLAPATEGLGLEQVVVHMNVSDPTTGELVERVMRTTTTVGSGLHVTFEEPTEDPVRPLTSYEQKVVGLRRRGLTHPYEIVKLLTAARSNAAAEFPPGDFQEYDLDGDNQLVPVDRPHGQNTAHVVVGLITNFTARVPEGMKRVVLLGDASKEMGSVSEPECRRILAGLELARELDVPVEWFTLSAGAKIAMDSGTENMDWVSRVLKGIIDFTQAGREINVVVCGINVGAQPYWNAEATMLMHTRGILVMTPDSAMVLTGKQALDYSGSVSAEDNQGIGGYERTMGPNGQAQYYAQDIAGSCRVLLAHYDHAYVVPGERSPRRVQSADPIERDVCESPHEGGDFASVGEVFSAEKNPGRKKPFDIRSVMRAVVDSDAVPLERWRDMRHAGIAVVWDAQLGGYPVCLLGLESKPIERHGFLPADGPATWTAGTLFPQSSKKVARAINSASGNRAVVVLANLSGFDGSPESMRRSQLEYGAEIGRAIVNFKGPVVFCVVSRYHGGAFVVFSKALNENLEVIAVEGAHASVIGGAPAAAVVFARDVNMRTQSDPRVAELSEQLAAAKGAKKAELRARLTETTALVHSEHLAAVAREFDAIHSVERALAMGSLDHIIPAAQLRPFLVLAVERGLARAARA